MDKATTEVQHTQGADATEGIRKRYAVFDVDTRFFITIREGYISPNEFIDRFMGEHVLTI